MWNLTAMREMWREFRQGAPLGDVAVLKFAAITATDPLGIAEKLNRVRGYAPPVDMAQLRALPSGTLGREYARFLDDNGIEPLQISERMRTRFADRPYVLRYTVTHDLHHLLTGFDTGLAGEVGVYAFTVAQGSAPTSSRFFDIVKTIYPLLSPSQMEQIRTNAKVGLEIGARSQLLLAEPLESLFDRPLASVRASLGIPDAREAGIRKSGTSWLADAVYRYRGGLGAPA